MANIAEVQGHALWTKGGPIAIHDHDTGNDIAALEEQAVATVADPTPFGLWAFATGTWMAGTVLGGAFAATTLSWMVPVLLLFAGIGQFIAGLFAYRRANSLAATAFCCFGSFNATFAAILMFPLLHIATGGADAPTFLGFLLESFAFIAFALGVAALRTNAAMVAVLMTLAIGYCFSGIPNLAGSTAGGWGVVGEIGGWVLVLSAALAYYTGMAMVVNSSWQRTAMPLGGQP